MERKKSIPSLVAVYDHIMLRESPENFFPERRDFGYFFQDTLIRQGRGAAFALTFAAERRSSQRCSVCSGRRRSQKEKRRM